MQPGLRSYSTPSRPELPAMWRPCPMSNSSEWTGFNPDFDTCVGCGGQMTPEWPGYGPSGPENGNCSDELDECIINILFRQMIEEDLWNGFAHDWDREQAVKWIHSKKKIWSERVNSKANDNLSKLIQAFKNLTQGVEDDA